MDAGVPAGERAPNVTAKEPWLGVNLSLCLPGLGDWYAGSRAAGALLLGAEAALIGLGGWFAFTPGGNGAIGMILLIGTVPLWLFSAWSAHRACRARATPEFEELRQSQRDAWKAVVLSRIIPGLGQIYDRRTVAGALLLVVAALMMALPGPAGALLYGSLAAGAALDAWRNARGRRATSAGAMWGIVAVVWLSTAGLPIGVAWVRQNLVQAFRIPSDSMSPALRHDDRVLADMRARGRARIGDIIVTSIPNQRRERFAKRVFALGGDVIEFRGDGAYRNNQRVLDGTFAPASAPPIGYGLEGSPYHVPEGSVFVIGDKPANSNDSRYLGPLPLGTVLGRVYKIYWPPARVRTF